MTLIHSLTLGGLTLTGDRSFADPTHGFWFEVCADGTEFGSPEAVTRIVTSLLSDGAIVSYDSDGNRAIPVRVRVNGPTLAAVAHGEAALRMASKRRNELTWQPPDTFAPPSVYETYPSAMSRQGDWDLDELRHVRTFNLSLTCSPFARSQNPTVVSTLPTGGSLSTATIDECDSATGWTATRSDAPVAATTFWEAGAVGAAELDPEYTAPETWTLTRTGSVAFTTMPYLVAEVRTVSYNGDLGVTAVTSTGTTLSLPILAKRNLEAGGDEGSYHEVVCLIPSSATLASITFVHTSQAGDPWQGLLIRKVSQTNMPPGISARQTSRIIDVGGTERTPASLRVSTTTGYLGVTLLHSTKFNGSGHSPDMRRWRSSGNTQSPNTDARKITGTWELMRPNPVISRTPAHSMPRGNYLLVAALKCDTATTTTPLPIDWAVKSVISGQTLGDAQGRGYGWFPVAHELTIVPIASMAAPVVRSGALDVEVHLLNPTDTVTMSIEQWWMFTDDDDSALSIVNTSEGALWVDSPDADNPVPTVWVGPSKPLSFHPGRGLVAQGTHTFKPGPVMVTTISDSNDYLSAELEYHKRWHSNAAE